MEWTEKYPDLHRTCKLFCYWELSNPLRYSYTPLKCYEQEGPQCGLVALAMSTGDPTKEFVDTLYKQAKCSGYTNNGEIFSANDMVELARRNLPPETDVHLYNGSLATDTVKNFLLDGKLLLVPYDNDVNHSPCQRRGHTAHWAVISGGVETTNGFFVIARHGTTRMLLIWNIEDLAISNAQLFEFSPTRELSGIEYKLPEDGIGGPYGLRCKCVVISNVKF